jgi:hypothetical protein
MYRGVELLRLLQWSAVELAGWAISEAHSAGRDQIHLQAHQRTSAHVLNLRPRYLDDVALCLVLCHACGRGMPAIARWTASRSAQASEPGAELVADTDVDESWAALAAQPVDALFARDEATLRCTVDVMPRRPRKACPMRAMRIVLAFAFTHPEILPCRMSGRGKDRADFVC